MISFRCVLSFPLFILISGCGPQSYDECIIDSMKGVSSDVAARNIRNACREIYPAISDAPSEEAEQLEYSDLKRVSGRLYNAAYGDSMYLEAYNGNSCITIKSLVVSISNSTGQKHYKIVHSIGPLSVEKAYFDIAVGGDKTVNTWTIDSGTGIKISNSCDEPNASSQPEDDFFNQDFSKFGQDK
jgi:hypothetical protein